MTLLYTAELDYPAGELAEFADWYAWRLAPDLFRIGFRSCTCYRAIEGRMGLLDLYEIPSWDIFTAPSYQAMGPQDPYCAAILEKRLDKSHTIYRQLPPESGPIDADWTTILRFAAAGLETEALSAWLREEQARLAARGAKRLRLAERATDHPVYPTRRPRYLVLAEWGERPPPARDSAARLVARFGEALADLDAFAGARLYPWPDDPRAKAAALG
jgi:hypothetical protein